MNTRDIRSFNATDPELAEQLVSGFEVISFDVFDTLLARRVVKPTDIFRYIESVHDLPGFHDARIQAEATARKVFRRGHGLETSLDEIYSTLGSAIDLKGKGPEIELEAEKKFLFANPAGVSILNAARRFGKRVVAVSDIYLSSAQVKELLTHCSIDIDTVLSSSDLRHKDIGKYNGRAFPFLSEKLNTPPGKILHVGDNATSDLTNALSNGVPAIQVRTNADLARHSWADGQRIFHRSSDTFSSSACVGTSLFTAATKNTLDRSTSFRFGYLYGGPLITSFAKYLVEACARDGVDNLLLLARDGYIVEEALRTLDIQHIAYEVVPASRRMMLFPLYAVDSGIPLLSALFGSAETRISRREFLDTLGLTAGSQNGDMERVSTVEEHRSHFHELLSEAAQAELTALQAYYQKLDDPGLPRRSAWVDVGWGMTSIRAIDALLNHRLRCYSLGTHGRAYHRPGMESYLFENGEPADTCDAIMSAPELIELFFSDCRPQAKGFSLGSDNQPMPVYYPKGEQEQLRDWYIREIREGMLQFVSDIKPHFHALSSDDTRSWLHHVWTDLCQHPNSLEYAFLSSIPHSREPGASTWKTIGAYWRPSTADQKAALPAKRRYKLLNAIFGEEVIATLRLQARKRKKEKQKRRTKKES